MLFFEVVDKHAPLVKIRIKKDKINWIDKDIRSLMRRENHKCHSQDKYKVLRAEVNHRIRQAKADHFSLICQDLSHQPRQTWRQLNSALVRKNRRSVNSLRCGDKTLTEKADIVNKFISQFSNLPLSSSKKKTFP